MTRNNAKTSLLITVVALTCLASLPTARSARAQDAAAAVARGKYIVEDVAVCWNCHTPRDQNGEPDRSRWLSGGPLFFEPTRRLPSWAQIAPRLAGLPPGTDREFVTLLTTGIARTGKPPDLPMPRFHMTREDAEAVLAYLKSLKASE